MRNFSETATPVSVNGAEVAFNSSLSRQFKGPDFRSQIQSPDWPFSALGPYRAATGIVFMLLISFIGPAFSVRINSIDVPPYHVAGKPAELRCHYQLRPDEELYSVKWYRNMKEFFRYIPSPGAKIMVFDLPGVSVDTALSDSSSVFLRTVSRQTSGKYRCEVSADTPTFHTEAQSAEMLVVDLPEEVPQISGGRKRYHVGDEVHFNCTSVKSRPAASLMRYINDRQAKMEYLIDHAPEQDKDGLETSQLGLKFIAAPRHFHRGVLRLKCTATIAAVYYQTSESVVKGSPPQKGPALESKGIYSGCCSSVSVTSLLFSSLLLIHVCDKVFLKLMTSS